MAERRKSVSLENFASAVATVANQGGTLADIANLTNMSTGSVATRLSCMRKDPRFASNVPSFKSNRGGGKRIDADKINAILTGKA